MKLTNLFKNFKSDESGAVTVDWVVLTAALVVVGGIVVTTVSDGMQNLAGDIDTALSGATVGTITLTTTPVTNP